MIPFPHFCYCGEFYWNWEGLFDCFKRHRKEDIQKNLNLGGVEGHTSSHDQGNAP